MRQYLDLLQDIIDNGRGKDDRTGTGTRSVFGRQLRFDLSKGFPLLTTKKVYWKAVAHELLWFLKGDTNIQYLNDNNVHIWDEWATDEGELGPVYGKMLRSYPPSNNCVLVKKKEVWDDSVIFESQPEYLEIRNDNGKYTGKTFTNKQGCEYVVVGQDLDYTIGKGESYPYTIQFIQSGWVKHNTKNVHLGNFVDQMTPSVHGVGVLGNYENKKESIINKKLKSHWENMLSRCYNPKDKSYSNYGDKGVVVCNRWHRLDLFIQDVKKIPNWFQKQSDTSYVLDKDYYGNSKIYHPECCVWVPREHNNVYVDNSIAVKATSEKGYVTYYPSIASASEALGISYNSLSKKIHSGETRKLKKDQFKGYKLEKFDIDGYLVRYPLYADQLKYVVDELKTNPNSRRLFINMWNPTLLPDPTTDPKSNVELGLQSLTPCHVAVQFIAEPLTLGERCEIAGYPLDGTFGPVEYVIAMMDNEGVPKHRLSCHLYQRSADVFLGVPFNIASYALLVEIIADIVNMQPGDFVHSFGDVHIYNNHVDQVNEQLSRTPKKLPTLKIKNKFLQSPEHYEFEDFELIGYDPAPAIKAKVSV